MIIFLFLVIYKNEPGISLRKSLVYTSRQPHILFILADDYGWNDIGKESFVHLIVFLLVCVFGLNCIN